MKARRPLPTLDVSKTPLPLLLGGIALGLSYPPASLMILAWAGLVPLLLRWDRAASWKTMLAEAFTMFLVTYAVAFFWPLLTAYSPTMLFSIGGLLFVPLLLALPFAASVPFRQRLGRTGGFVALAAFYLTLESALSFGPFAFPWPLLAHTQAEAIDLIQMAALTGAIGLSLWVLLLNGLLFGAFVTNRLQLRVVALAAAVVLIAVPVGAGRLVRNQLAPPTQYVTVGLVQPGLRGMAPNSNSDPRRIDRLVALSDSLIDTMGMPPVFMIWPEAFAAGLSPVPQQRMQARLNHWANGMQVALLTKTLTPDGVSTGKPRFYNSALLFRPGDAAVRYDQKHLAPFAEQVPMSDAMPWLESLFFTPQAPRYRPGVRSVVMPFDDISVGVLMGFESLLGGYVRSYNEQKADFLVAMTLDGWLGSTAGHKQHLAYLRLRAVETRRAVVQVGTTGSTGLLFPDGTTVHEIGPMERVARLAAVPVYHQSTFYARHGNYLGLAALFFSLVLGGWWFMVGRREVD